LRHEYRLSSLLEAASLSRRTFYYQVQAAERPDGSLKLKRKIEVIYNRHKGRYGYRRIAEALRTAGEQINRKAVQRLMKLMGLKSLVRAKKYRSYRGPAGTVAPNQLERTFRHPSPTRNGSPMSLSSTWAERSSISRRSWIFSTPKLLPITSARARRWT
jgi:putative transposase